MTIGKIVVEGAKKADLVGSGLINKNWFVQKRRKTFRNRSRT
jgi:hypothetical protein